MLARAFAEQRQEHKDGVSQRFARLTALCIVLIYGIDARDSTYS